MNRFFDKWNKLKASLYCSNKEQFFKEGSFLFVFELDGQKSNSLLLQGRVYDSKRLENKIGKMPVDVFKRLKIKLRELLDVWIPTPTPLT